MKRQKISLILVMAELRVQKIKPGSEQFWSVLFFISRLYDLVLPNGKIIPSNEIMLELEEVHMEKYMQNPQTKEAFLFWAWNRCEDREIHPTYDGYDEFWQIRHKMLIYHYLHEIKRDR